MPQDLTSAIALLKVDMRKGQIFAIAPEAMRGRRSVACPACDAWSLGCLLYFMATGGKPVFDRRFSYDASPLKGLHDHAIFDDPYAFFASEEMDTDLADVIQKLLDASPKRRLSIEVVHNGVLSALVKCCA